jgi:hypothetical protein
MLNPNISLYPDSVFPWMASNLEGIEYGVSEEIFMTGNRSLFIGNPDSVSTRAGFWTQTYTGQMPVPGSSVELTAFLKGENIEDLTQGSSIGIFFQVLPRIDSKGNSHGISISSVNTIKLEGGFDWRLIRVAQDSFPVEADNIEVRLIAPTLTSGRVYFDGISLTAN